MISQENLNEMSAKIAQEIYIKRTEFVGDYDYGVSIVDKNGEEKRVRIRVSFLDKVDIDSLVSTPA